MIMEENCGTCRFYMHSPHVCRRYPPKPIMVGVEQGMGLIQPKPVIQTYFPQMAPNGWCGDYKSIEQSGIIDHVGTA
jgi:hypothetical protein